MSRILRRPMFRGGPVDSYGTGIASGLGYKKGGRVGYNNGNLVAPLYSAVPDYKSGAEIKRDAPGIFGLKFNQPFLSMKTPENRFGGSLNFGLSPKELGEALSEGSSYTNYLKNLNQPEEFETEVTETGDVKFKLDEKGNKIPIETKELSLKEQIEKDRIQKITDSDTQGSLEELGITVKDDGTTEFTGDPRYCDQKIKKTDTSGIKLPPPPTEKEESVEYTVEDYVKMLGGDKARRRDLSDMLAGASAAFLGTGSVKEGFAEFMAKEAAKGPGRLEKIEQAAATLDIKDKIASKRADEQLKMLLGRDDYQAMLKLRLADPSLQSFETNLVDTAKSLGKSYKNTGVIGNTINKKYGSGSFGGEIAEGKDYVEGKFYIQDTGTGEKIVFKIVEGEAQEVHRII